MKGHLSSVEFWYFIYQFERVIFIRTSFKYYIPILLFYEEHFNKRINFLAVCWKFEFFNKFRILKLLVRGGFWNQIQNESYFWASHNLYNNNIWVPGKFQFDTPPYYKSCRIIEKRKKKKLYLNPSGFDDHCKSNMAFLLIRVKIVKCTSREMQCYNFQISASRNSSNLFLGLLEKTKIVLCYRL